MAYSVIIKTVKPADKQWWGPQVANRTKSASIRTQTEATSGLIASSAGQSPNNVNVWVIHQLWESQAAYEAYAAALETNVHYQERNAYGAANNFVTTRYHGAVSLA
jgi:hypothetical protein